MQCIAGVHYNYSLPESLWLALDPADDDARAHRNRGYIGLIRNFTRYAWLLMYLFGATPALSRDFLRGRDHGLQTLDADTLYLPHATSLRMSDLGYQKGAVAAQVALQRSGNLPGPPVRRRHAALAGLRGHRHASQRTVDPAEHQCAADR